MVEPSASPASRSVLSTRLSIIPLGSSHVMKTPTPTFSSSLFHPRDNFICLLFQVWANVFTAIFGSCQRIPLLHSPIPSQKNSINQHPTRSSHSHNHESAFPAPPLPHKTSTTSWEKHHLTSPSTPPALLLEIQRIDHLIKIRLRSRKWKSDEEEGRERGAMVRWGKVVWHLNFFLAPSI